MIPSTAGPPEPPEGQTFEPYEYEPYKLMLWFFGDVKNKSHIRDPDLDAFGTEEHHVVEAYWGPGSAWGLFAADRDWSRPLRHNSRRDPRPLLWCNPPPFTLYQVVDKLIADRALAVLICPHWGDQLWLRKIMGYTCKRYFYRHTKHIFQAGCLPWGIWTLLVDASAKWNKFSVPITEEDVLNPVTATSGRRRRREAKWEKMCLHL